MTHYKNVILRKGKTESIRRFHPWIFSGALAQVSPDIQEGDIVRVLDAEGTYLCTGHFQGGSIAVRILSFEDVEIDSEFWNDAIEKALTLRKDLNLKRKDNNTFRLIHGEGDNLPGLIVDIFDHTAVMQSHSYGMHLCRTEIAQALMQKCGDFINAVYYKSETTLPFKNGDVPENGFLIGQTSDNVAIENGLRFHIDWLKGQKTGFFVDQRENRQLLELLSKGKRVLNLFCYTGGFSVYAMRGGAEYVHSVDSSGKAIDLATANMNLNFPENKQHKEIVADAFKYLDKTDVPYDLMILDPPAFAKHRGAIPNAIKGYTRLNAAAFSKIEKGGIVFTFSCSQAINKEQFRLAVFTAAAQAKRDVKILYQLHQPADHPINIFHPEGEYLKGLVLKVN